MGAIIALFFAFWQGGAGAGMYRRHADCDRSRGAFTPWTTRVRTTAGKAHLWVRLTLERGTPLSKAHPCKAHPCVRRTLEQAHPRAMFNA